MVTSAPPATEREAELKAFDDTKTGVKGLVDAGITVVPSIFRHHPQPPPASAAGRCLSIPIVDLSLPRAAAVEQILSASASWGFFYLVSHGIPLPTIASTVTAVRSFHDLPAEARTPYYTRNAAAGDVSYFSNIDLFRSPAASWRDTLQIVTAPTAFDPAHVPEICRREAVEWDAEVLAVVRRLAGMLSEGLGLPEGRLEELSLLEGRVMVCHCYPPCPEPEATVGAVLHTDPSVLTVLVQDDIGGLQVKSKMEDGLEVWVDVKPLPGALVINIGDFLQIISNDEYKSSQHRVMANPSHDARISIATFFNPGKRGEFDLYGPLPELVSPEKPAIYRNFTHPEFLRGFFDKGLRTKHMVDCFKLTVSDDKQH